jgi:hypothetical protein
MRSPKWHSEQHIFFVGVHCKLLITRTLLWVELLGQTVEKTRWRFFSSLVIVVSVVFSIVIVMDPAIVVALKHKKIFTYHHHHWHHWVDKVWGGWAGIHLGRLTCSSAAGTGGGGVGRRISWVTCSWVATNGVTSRQPDRSSMDREVTRPTYIIMSDDLRRTL